MPCQSRWFALPIQLRGVFRPWAGEARGLQPPEKICKYAWKKVGQTSFWPPIFSRIRLCQKWKAIHNKVKPYRRASFPWHVCLKILPWQPTFFLFRKKNSRSLLWNDVFYDRISDWDNTWSCTLVSKAIGIFINITSVIVRVLRWASCQLFRWTTSTISPSSIKHSYLLYVLCGWLTLLVLWKLLLLLGIFFHGTWLLLRHWQPTLLPLCWQSLSCAISLSKLSRAVQSLFLPRL